MSDFAIEAKVSAVLLAAGESRRMGEFKQLLRIQDKTFVEHCVDNLLASQVSEVVVVTGHRAEEIHEALRGRKVGFANNREYSSGMSTSIKCGVRAIAKDAAAVLIALADQPLIETRIINALVDTYKNDRKLVVIPRYRGRNGHPIILDLTLRTEIMRIGEGEGLKRVVHAHAEETAWLDVESEAVLIDFDLPSDLEHLSHKSD